MTDPGKLVWYEIYAVAKAIDLGATLQQDVTPIAEGAGVLALVSDPDGNQIGLWSES